MANLRIIVPAHNEELRIAPTLHSFCSYFAGRAEITVVLNGCRDNTKGVVSQLMEQYDNLSMVDIPAAIGKGGAVRIGFMLATEPYLGFVDADGSFDPSEFERLYTCCQAEKIDGAIASRALAGAEGLTPVSPLRRFASSTFKSLCRGLFRFKFRDTQCGAKLFRRDVLIGVLDDLELANFAFDVDLLYRLTKLGAVIREVPIIWEDKEGSKVDVLRTSISMLQAMLRLRLRRSWLGHIPYLDMFARQSVITVARGIRVLMLGDMHCARSQRTMAVLSDHWRRLGYDIEIWPRRQRSSLLGSVMDRIAFAFWYVFVSDRSYDALIEIASDLPYLLPSFSVKRSFLIGAPSGRVASFIYDKWYRRSNIQRCMAEPLHDLLAKIRMGAMSSRLYAARLFWLDRGLALTYADRTSGEHREQSLSA